MSNMKAANITARRRGRGSERSAGAAERWVRSGKSVKRLTIEVEAALHRRLRIHAATEGRSMADVVRELLEGACPM